MDDGMSMDGDFIFANDLGVNNAQAQIFDNNKHQPLGLIPQESPLKQLPTFDELLALEDDTLDQDQFPTEVSLALHDTPDQQPGSWCAWTRGNVSLAVVTEDPLMRSNSTALEVLQPERPHAQHNADIIIHSLRSFPTMMLRRETFPWFIHPHSQLLSESAEAVLPKALSICMSIAQMFASRTSETKYFLRQTIGAEHGRFMSEMYFMTEFELLAAMQACMIYLIMYIIDYSPEDEGNARDLLLALHASLYLYS
ncbi:hypothetical protein MMC13_003776 [Lambiella insularis]|nr:hypothetical protein [Lambiella insularis]